jgi:hypothetical protein
MCICNDTVIAKSKEKIIEIYKKMEDNAGKIGLEVNKKKPQNI